MREIAETADVSNSTAHVLAALHPFLESASVEEWQLLLAYVWDSLIGPEEWKVFEICNEIISMATQLGHDCSEMRGLQDKAFTQPHDIVHFITFRLDPDVDRRLVLREVVKALIVADMKRKKWRAVRKHLQDWQQRLAKRDSLIGETGASGQA